MTVLSFKNLVLVMLMEEETECDKIEKDEDDDGWSGQYHGALYIDFKVE